MVGIRKVGSFLATLGLATAVTVGLGANSASAADSVQTFRNGSTGECLDDSDLYWVRTYGCNPGPNQQWTVHSWADGTIRLQNIETGLCIGDWSGPERQTCDDSRMQSWFVHHWPDGGITFINQSSDLCLDDSADFGLRTFPCSDIAAGQQSPYQTWY